METGSSRFWRWSRAYDESLTDLREMSDEQLTFTLKESAESLFRLRIQGADRTARRPQRVAQTAADDRPREDDSNRARRKAAAKAAASASQAGARPA